MHRTSLADPKHPKHEIKEIKIPVAINTYTAPAYKFVPRSSLAKDLSTTVHIPSATTVIPPSYMKSNKLIINIVEV